MKRLFLAFLVALIILVGTLPIRYKHTFADNQKPLPRTITLIAEEAKTDSSILEILENFPDDACVIAYPPEYGGGISIQTNPNADKSFGKIYDATGEQVIYSDEQFVTVADIREAIGN